MEREHSGRSRFYCCSGLGKEAGISQEEVVLTLLSGGFQFSGVLPSELPFLSGNFIETVVRTATLSYQVTKPRGSFLFSAWFWFQLSGAE